MNQAMCGLFIPVTCWCLAVVPCVRASDPAAPAAAAAPPRATDGSARDGGLVSVHAAAVEWTFHKTLDGLHPDGNEQQMVWLMNRARANPALEGEFLATVPDPNVSSSLSSFGVDLAILRSEFSSYPAKPPAAFDARLYEGARVHSEDLIARDAQDHNNQFQRVKDAGFQYRSARGSVFSFARSGLHAHGAFNVDWGSDGGDGSGMQPGRGHRQAIMSLDGNYSNMGVAMIREGASSTIVGPLVTTVNYAEALTSVANQHNRFIVGTVWKDLDGDMMYDPGEGKAGVRVGLDSGSFFAVTGDAGGYAIPVTQAGSYRVTFSGGALDRALAKTVLVGGASVLVDAGNEAPIEAARLTGVRRVGSSVLRIEWSGGTPPFQVQVRGSLSSGQWENTGDVRMERFAELSVGPGQAFYRVESLGESF